MNKFDNDLSQCLATLKAGGLILYPTDTIWGIGCDCLNESAIQKVYELKKRAESKALLLLAKNFSMIRQFTSQPLDEIEKYVSKTNNPTTVIYHQVTGLPEKLLAENNSVGMRIPDDEFCLTLLESFGRPIISTSANVSGSAAPKYYAEISDIIKNGVDYIVQHRREDMSAKNPSTIIELLQDGSLNIIRA